MDTSISFNQDFLSSSKFLLFIISKISLSNLNYYLLFKSLVYDTKLLNVGEYQFIVWWFD